MSNDRFDDDADPFGNPNEPVHPNLDRADVDPNATRTFRIPDHVSLARVRYHRDPVFHGFVTTAYKWLDLAEAPEDVFEEYAGRRIRITKNLLGEEYYGGDVEPFVAVVTDDERVDALLDWADDTPSPYARREVPASIEAAKQEVSDSTADTIDDAFEVYENHANVSKAEFDAFVADMVEIDPVEAPTPDAEPGGSTDEAPVAPVDTGDVWKGLTVAAGLTVLILIALAIVFGVV